MHIVIAIAFSILAFGGLERDARGEESTPANYALLTDLHLSDEGAMPPLDNIVSRAKFCDARWLGMLGDTSNQSWAFRSNWGILSTFLTRTWGGPFFCVPGNHDVDSTDSLTALRAAVGNDYFVLNDGGCAFVFLDTPLLVAKNPDDPTDYHLCEGERQAHWNWLETQLAGAAREQRRIYVFGHHPLYVNAEDEGDNYWNFHRPDRTRMLELCRRFEVQAWFCGHLHRTVDHSDQSPRLYVSGSVNYSFDARGTGFRLLQITRTGFHAYWVRTDLPDTDRPTTPTLLTVKRVAGDKALATWQPSADANGIAFYRVFVDGKLVMDRNIGEECTLDGLPVPAANQISVDAVDPFGNISGAATTTIEPIPLSAADGWHRYQ